MPLASARLTSDGIKPSAQTTAELDRLAAIAARELAAEQARAEAAARNRDERNHAVVLRPNAGEGRCPQRWRPVPGDAQGIPVGPVAAGGRSGYLVLWLQDMRVGADWRDAQSQPGHPCNPDYGTHQSRAAARDRASVLWRTEPGPNAGRLSTARAALDVRAGWRDGQDASKRNSRMLEAIMALVFIAIDPDTTGDHCPAVFAEEETGDLLFQGW
jgi:hypothetical protein